MGQIVRRKKKGRPSKADLARRNGTAEAPHEGPQKAERDVRRSLRRRNVKYVFDFDDYIDDDDEFEDEQRREKKLKLLLSLHIKDGDAESAPARTRRVGHAPAISASSSEGKNKKVDGDDEIDGADEEDKGNGNEIDDGDEEEVNSFESEWVHYLRVKKIRRIF